MGICESNKKNIKEQACFPDFVRPLIKNEADELFGYESAICKIRVNNDKTYNKSLGFFCEINDKDIPFRRALFTNNHILDKSKINTNQEIEIEYLKELKRIKINKERKKFTSIKYDYTCIEIFETDKIKKFFKIDKRFFENKNALINKEIFILQYLSDDRLSYSHGLITEINSDTLIHNSKTLDYISGYPLIERYSINLIFGMRAGTENSATPFDLIIRDIKNRINHHLQKITLLYDKSKVSPEDLELFSEIDLSANQIFGEDFVNNNKDNIKLIINGQESPLVEKYELKEGINTIQMIILNKLTNVECMFMGCTSLINIDDLKYLDTKEIENFYGMFSICLSLSNINALENWNVSHGNDFKYMFAFCKSLTNLNALQKWDVSHGNTFEMMFAECTSLINLNALQKWDVSNGCYYQSMFYKCSSLVNLNGLHNWNVSNGKLFFNMFHGCSELLDLKGLEKWNVSNGQNFSYMFRECDSLTNLNGLENWDVSKGITFACMFSGCFQLSKVNALRNWNVSKGTIFTEMFDDCDNIKDVTSVGNWNVSNGKGFDYIFPSSILLQLKGFKNWDIAFIKIGNRSDSSFSYI